VRFLNTLKHLLIEKTVLTMSLIGMLYFIGVGSIIYPLISNILSLKTSDTTISSYQKVVEEMPPAEIREKFEMAHNYNDGLSGKSALQKDNAKVLNGADGIICYVAVPKVDIYLPVYYGTDEEVLKKGCGYLENTSLPVGGESTHSVISAHTGLPTAEMFTRLDEVQKGDLFYIYVLNEKLTYKVDNINAVTPNAVEELYITNGKDYVTLLTCTPYGINDKRLLVRGERVVDKAQNSKDNTEDNQTAFDNDTPTKDTGGLSAEIHRQLIVVVTIVSVAVGIFLIGCIWLGITVRKMKKR